MPELPLVFRGMRGPAATGAGRQTIAVPRADGSLQAVRGFVSISTTGDGRSWKPEITDGTWRDLADLDLDSFPDCTAFVRRRGDPHGLLKKSGTEPGSGFNYVNTSQWLYLAEGLRAAANAWDAPGEDGISRVTTDPARLRDAAGFLDLPGAAHALKSLALTRDPEGSLGLALTTTSPAAFLVASAAAALQRRADMRHCRHCQGWFEITRSDVRFCSASCRATHHKTEKEASHGEHQKKAWQERPDNMAKRVARAGEKRPKPAADKEPRKRQGSPRARIKDGAGGRAPRRR
jgi:hypothetical protein